MTVDDVLRAITAAFPNFNAKALEAWAPIYRAQLGRHEGPALRDAHLAVMGSIKPSGRTPFPLPADYAAHLPSDTVLHKVESWGPKLDFAAHRERKGRLVEAWQAGQGAKIKGARGPAIYAHCLWEAQRLAAIRAWRDEPGGVILSMDQIQRCEDQAVSLARMDAHGAAVLRRGDASAWEAQTAAIRATLRAGERPMAMDTPGEANPSVRPSQAMQERLAEMARARRQTITMGESDNGQD